MYFVYLNLQSVYFTNFFNRLGLIIQKVYNNNHNIIICGDIIVNYQKDNNNKSQTFAELYSYNVMIFII
jgi:hypothetical protein